MILRFNVGLGFPAPLFTSAGKHHLCLQWRHATSIDCLCTYAYADISDVLQRQSYAEAFQPSLLSWEPTPRAEKISQH